MMFIKCDWERKKKVARVCGEQYRCVGWIVGAIMSKKQNKLGEQQEKFEKNIQTNTFLNVVTRKCM